MGKVPDVRIVEGLAALEADPTYLVDLLDDVYARWAQSLGAVPLTAPPVLPVKDLARLDVYKNFPQLALVSSALDVSADKAGRISQEAESGHIAVESLHSAGLALPSSACYGVYLHYRGRRVEESGTLITVLGQCYRNEQSYDGLRRLKAFRMREVVALGTPEQAASHLERSARFLEALAEQIGLPLERRVASDPFYNASGDRAAFQQIVPVKHEYVYRGMAIASVNAHFTFFGERCAIRLPDGGAASTSCVGFGMERWLDALVDHFGGWSQAQDAVKEAGTRLLDG